MLPSNVSLGEKDDLHWMEKKSTTGQFLQTSPWFHCHWWERKAVFTAAVMNVAKKMLVLSQSFLVRKSVLPVPLWYYEISSLSYTILCSSQNFQRKSSCTIILAKLFLVLSITEGKSGSKKVSDYVCVRNHVFTCTVSEQLWGRWGRCCAMFALLLCS